MFFVCHISATTVDVSISLFDWTINMIDRKITAFIIMLGSETCNVC